MHRNKIAEGTPAILTFQIARALMHVSDISRSFRLHFWCETYWGGEGGCCFAVNAGKVAPRLGQNCTAVAKQVSFVTCGTIALRSKA